MYVKHFKIMNEQRFTRAYIKIFMNIWRPGKTFRMETIEKFLYIKYFQVPQDFVLNITVIDHYNIS